MALFLPFIISLLYGLAIGAAPQSLHLAVVNEDYPCSQGEPNLPTDCETQVLDGLSCRFLRNLDKRMFIVVRLCLPRLVSGFSRKLPDYSRHIIYY